MPSLQADHDVGHLRRRLLRWYDTHRRDLPWRGLDDPYAVWVSEVMLQQTRVETVVPYFLRWMTRFPDIAALAAADEDAVLRQWQGLGYYRRARLLLAGARYVTDTCDGTLPGTYDDLLAVPGIGTYTAGAIASIAFDEPVPAVDGNVLRVLARLGHIEDDILKGAGRRAVTRLARRLVPAARPGDWNQALMELGATLCTPRGPECPRCPLRHDCAARLKGTVDRIPVRGRRAPVTTHDVVFAAIEHDDRVLLVKNLEDGLLGGLWGLPGGVSADGLAEAVTRQTGLQVAPGPALGTAEHRFTHRHWRITVHACTLRGSPAAATPPAQVAWVTRDALDDYPVSRALGKALHVAGWAPS